MRALITFLVKPIGVGQAFWEALERHAMRRSRPPTPTYYVLEEETKTGSEVAVMGSHLIDGKFQSDKYPTCPPGKVPLSVEDPMAQDLLWEYAQRRRSVDAEFSEDLETALAIAGCDACKFVSKSPTPPTQVAELPSTQIAALRAQLRVANEQAEKALHELAELKEELNEPAASSTEPRVDQFMSDDDLTAAAGRIRQSVDWSRLPRLRVIFKNRLSLDRYWHELVALTLTSLEVNSDAMTRRSMAEFNALCSCGAAASGGGHLYNCAAVAKLEFNPIIIESPFKGATGSDEEYARNRRYLQRCILDCLERGETPYASHQMLTEALDDRIPEQREKGRQAGLAMRRFFPKRAVYLDLGASDRMKQAVELYDRERLPYTVRWIGAEP